MKSLYLETPPYIQKRYAGMHVARNPKSGRVVAAGKDAKVMFDQIDKKGIGNKPLAFQVIPRRDVLYIF